MRIQCTSPDLNPHQRPLLVSDWLLIITTQQLIGCHQGTRIEHRYVKTSQCIVHERTTGYGTFQRRIQDSP